MRLRRIATPVIVASVILGLVACAPSSPDPTETPLPAITVTPSDTPAPEPEPVAASCESLLSTSLAQFTGGGLSIEGPGAYADKLHAEGNAFAGFYDAGGVFCIVSGGMEAYALYGWAPFDDASWEPIKASLLAEAWEEEVTDAGLLYTSVVPQPLSVCYYRPNAFGGCAATSELLDEVLANAPA